MSPDPLHPAVWIASDEASTEPVRSSGLDSGLGYAQDWGRDVAAQTLLALGSRSYLQVRGTPLSARYGLGAGDVETPLEEFLRALRGSSTAPIREQATRAAS
jgi:hypothetical protein